MTPEHLDQLVRWFQEEREAFRSKGARGDILKEPAFLQLVWDAVIAQHAYEILATPGFFEDILKEASS